MENRTLLVSSLILPMSNIFLDVSACAYKHQKNWRRIERRFDFMSRRHDLS